MVRIERARGSAGLCVLAIKGTNYTQIYHDTSTIQYLVYGTRYLLLIMIIVLYTHCIVLVHRIAYRI